jgi:hypothetical protein
MPNEPFNSLVREGTAAQTLGRIIEETKPEAIYFSEYDGKRCAIAIYEADAASKVPSLVEPWFLTFDADCRIQIAMTPEDLKQARLEDLGKRWRG